MDVRIKMKLIFLVAFGISWATVCDLTIRNDLWITLFAAMSIMTSGLVYVVKNPEKAT